jgi:hypothetical protein
MMRWEVFIGPTTSPGRTDLEAFPVKKKIILEVL